jgi:TonB family protein
MTQLWLIRAGEDGPKMLPADAEFSNPDISRPYIFQTERMEMAAMACDPPLDVKGFAEVMLATEGIRGNIVIGESTPARFRERERELLAELEEHGIQKTLIKTFHKRVRRDVMEEFVELWIVPPKTVAQKPSDRLVVMGERTYEPPAGPPVGEPSKPASSPLPPPPPKPSSIGSGEVLNSKAISLPKPSYPAAARETGASGTVIVQVMIDENGNVASAKAISGHETLLAVCEAAAREAKFSPTIADGKPVKVGGVIVYEFRNTPK